MVALGDSARNESSSKHRVVAARLYTFGDKHSTEVGFQSSAKEIKPPLSFQISFFLITTNTIRSYSHEWHGPRGSSHGRSSRSCLFFLFKSYYIPHPEGSMGGLSHDSAMPRVVPIVSYLAFPSPEIGPGVLSKVSYGSPPSHWVSPPRYLSDSRSSCSA